MLKNKVLFFLFSSLLGISAQAGGTDVYYGGDVIITQFQEIQDDLYRDIKLIPQSVLPIPDLSESFLHVRKKLMIEIQEHLFIDGKEVGFVNFPNARPQKIQISRALWNCENKVNQYCRRVVLHEMIHLLKHDDRTYFYSSKIIQAIHFVNQSKTVKDWARPLFSNQQDIEMDLASWFFIHINQAQKIPQHPLYWGADIDQESLNTLKTLVDFLKKNDFLDDEKKNLVVEIEKFIAHAQTKYIPPGLFIIGINIYYSNGQHYCLFANMDDFTQKTGKISANGIQRLYKIPAIMRNDGFCN